MYSLDFRKRVLAIQEKDHLTFKETSERFDIGIKTLSRWKQRIEPITKRNTPERKIDREKLKKDVNEHPDKYQWERAKEFGVAQSSIFYALKRLGKTFKKNSASPESR